MIKITIELVPPILSEEIRKVIGRAEIINVGTGTKEKGDYRYALWGKRESAWRMGEIKNFPRKSYNVWKLLYLVLKAVFE